ncbi:hypothetical protein Tco_0053763 [Tanacetum coccineum]
MESEVKDKGERGSLALKAKKESSDEECLTSRSEDEEYVMAVRDLKKFFKRRGRCGDPNHIIGECPKPSKDKNQRAFVRDSWSDSGKEDDEKVKDKMCLMAHTSSEEDATKHFIQSTMVGDLVDKGVASIVTSSPSFGIISKHCLSSSYSLSSTFCFLELSCSRASPALFELLSYAIFASAFLELSSINSVL